MRKVWIFITALVISLVPIRTLADENQNFKIPEQNYELLSLFYTPEYIDTMTYDEYTNFMAMNINPSSVTKTEKYYRVVINNLTDEVEETEITEEEYENADVEEPNRSIVYETNYKKIILSLSHTNENANYFSFTAKWKKMPATRSYDDIGVRLSGFETVDGSQITKQIYKLSGTNISINYPFGGINSKYFDNGYGVSIGLIGSNITELQCTTSASMIINWYPAYIYASYQHAVNTITLATAKNYTIGLGLGNVFVFGSGVASNFDGMSGISTHIYS